MPGTMKRCTNGKFQLNIWWRKITVDKSRVIGWTHYNKGIFYFSLFYSRTPSYKPTAVSKNASLEAPDVVHAKASSTHQRKQVSQAQVFCRTIIRVNEDSNECNSIRVNIRMSPYDILDGYVYLIIRPSDGGINNTTVMRLKNVEEKSSTPSQL